MGEVKLLPNNGMAPSNEDIARHLSELAEGMVAKDAANVQAAIIVYEYADGSTDTRYCGVPMDNKRAAGILQAAAMKMLFDL